jgi:choline dehydrogenase-like flavoprotein
MIRDGNGVPAGSTLEADLCIVGAGAAGISLAQKLVGSGLRVIVLESGGREPDAATQRLYAGESVGAAQPPLDASRLRRFGGTTNHWAGWCRPLDSADFAAPAWVPESGWPIARDDLAPYYAAAHTVCDLGPPDFGAETWGRFADPIPGLAEFGLRTLLLQLSPPTRFGEKFDAALSAADDVELLLESNLTALVPDPEVRTVRHAAVATLAGVRFRVAARRFVLACGAIENARLLLSSNEVAAAGLGNDRDLVGRYFMDHPRVRPAGVLLWTDAAARKLEQYTRIDGVRATAALEIDFERQRRDRLSDSLMFTEGPIPPDAIGAARAPDLATARFLAALGGETAALSEWWIRCEQAPNPDSRVTLAAERDALGQPRARLEWRLQGLDRHTLGTSSRVYVEALSRAGVARVKVAPWLLREPLDTAAVTGDWHHMGTTRMASSPDRGVVDRDCRVFGLDNLYVAGASVFPTAGAMNPTLTLVALALRLADHVRSRLG